MLISDRQLKNVLASGELEVVLLKSSS